MRCDLNGAIYAVYSAAMRMRDGLVDHLFYTLPANLLQTPDDLVKWQKLEGDNKTRRVDIVVRPEALVHREAGATVTPNSGSINHRQNLEDLTPGGWWGVLQFGRNSQSGFWVTTQYPLQSNWAIDTDVPANMPAKVLTFHEDAADYASAYPTAWDVFRRAATLFGGIQENSFPVGGNRHSSPGGGLEILERSVEADRMFRAAKDADKKLRQMPEAQLMSLLAHLGPEQQERLKIMRDRSARGAAVTE